MSRSCTLLPIRGPFLLALAGYRTMHTSACSLQFVQVVDFRFRWIVNGGSETRPVLNADYAANLHAN